MSLEQDGRDCHDIQTALFGLVMIATAAIAAYLPARAAAIADPMKVLRHE